MNPDMIPMSVQVLEWKPLVRGTLRGWAVLQIGQLIIRNVAIFNSGAEAWASLPTKPTLGKDGNVRRGPDGKLKYEHDLAWANRATQDRFSAGVVLALENAHPGATR